MKSFIVKLIIFSLCTVSLILLLSVIPKTGNKNTYLEGIVQKHERLLSIKSPKIIIAGGSNMAFGINSEEIEKEFSMPVVNLSIHGGLGAPFILGELKESIAPGDVVFLSLEYFLGDGDDRLKKHASEIFPPASKYYTMDRDTSLFIYLDDIRENIKNGIISLINPQRFLRDKIYSRDAFNKYGDVISHLDKENKTSLSGKQVMEYEYWNKIEAINEFYNYASRMNTSVFYLFPTFAESQYEKNKEVISLLREDLDSDLKIDIINEPSTFVFNDSLFFDTVYHLNKNGREKRTVKMIQLLRNNKNVQRSLKRQW
jgi:hypothetical protein